MAWAWIMATAGLTVTLTVGGGCCEHGPSQRCVQYVASAGPQGRLTPALLFDRHPGRYDASQFAYRSDWPSSPSFYSPGQVIFFNERFVDFQGRGFDESDYTYRRFDTQRVGVGYR